MLQLPAFTTQSNNKGITSHSAGNKQATCNLITDQKRAKEVELLETAYNLQVMGCKLANWSFCIRLALGACWAESPRKLGSPEAAEDATAAQIRLLAALPST